jgi:hypothetical protein
MSHDINFTSHDINFMSDDINFMSHDINFTCGTESWGHALIGEATRLQQLRCEFELERESMFSPHGGRKSMKQRELCHV